MMRVKDAMAEQHVVPQETNVVQQLQRSAAVLAQDAVELDQIHRGVQRDPQCVLIRRLAGRFQQLDRAGIQLGGIEHAPHTAIVGAIVFARELHGAVETGFARGWIRIPLNPARLVECVGIRFEARPEVHACAKLADHPHQLDRIARADVHDRRGAAANGGPHTV